MRVCVFSKDGSVPPECRRDSLVLYVPKGAKVEGVEKKEVEFSNFWDLVFKLFIDEPCDVVCVTPDYRSLALLLAALLRRDKACAYITDAHVEVSIVGAWVLLQLDEPLRTIALYAMAKGDMGVSPKEIVMVLGDRLGLDKGTPSSYKLAWNYLKELEKKNVVERVLRGRYVVKKELLLCEKLKNPTPPPESTEEPR